MLKMDDEDHITADYRCKKCGKILPIIGSIKPRNPNWYCTRCGNEGPLGEAFVESEAMKQFCKTYQEIQGVEILTEKRKVTSERVTRRKCSKVIVA